MAAKKKSQPEPAKFARCGPCGVTKIVCRLMARPGEKGAPCCVDCEHEGMK